MEFISIVIKTWFKKNTVYRSLMPFINVFKISEEVYYIRVQKLSSLAGGCGPPSLSLKSHRNKMQ